VPVAASPREAWIRKSSGPDVDTRIAPPAKPGIKAAAAKRKRIARKGR
jgi:hypothetical protein